MRWFCTLLRPQPAERILDVGGASVFWAASPPASAVTLLNVAFGDRQDPRFIYVQGDACALPFAAREFDVLFSNSVIEHVGTWERQQLFAAEARRVGRKLWVQTPAREFFIEPHLIAPFIHWLPLGWQRRLIRNFTVRGWLERPDRTWIDGFLREVRLLTYAEMQALFPDCTILRERFLGLTKSYIAVRRHP